MTLTFKQTSALDHLEDTQTNEILFGGGAGGGKSALGCYWLIKSCLKYPGTRWVMGRAVLKTLKETTLNSFYDVAQIQGLKAGTHYSFNAQSNVIRFPNQSEILLKDLFQYPSDPNFDELGSLEITGAFVDECNQITEKAWNILRSRIRYKVDAYGLIPKMLGSCNPSKTWVYANFFNPHKQNNLPKTKVFIQSLLTDNPYISKHYKDSLLTLDENSKQRLLYGNWQYHNDPSALMSFEKIQAIFNNDHLAELGESYITADIARLGRDKTVIGVWNGFKCNHIITLDKNKITEAASIIKDTAILYNVPFENIIVDEDGVGGGVVDILDCKGFVNNSTPLEDPESGLKENYVNLKSQCYFRLAQLINKNGMFVKTSSYQQSIIEELEQVKQFNMDKDGKKAIMPKDKVKEILGRSPDFSDMLMMRMWFELAPKFEWYI